MARIDHNLTSMLAETVVTGKEEDKREKCNSDTRKPKAAVHQFYPGEKNVMPEGTAKSNFFVNPIHPAKRRI